MARLEPITSKEQVAPEHHGTFDAIVASRGAVQGPFTMLMHHPDLAAHVGTLGGYIRFEGDLDMRSRVLAAMTVAREFDAMYVWGAQTSGARSQGVPESTIDAIRENRSDGMSADDAQIVEYTRQLLRNHRVDDATFKALADRFGTKNLIQLACTIGYYSFLSMAANTTMLDVAPGQEVLKV
jgi:4-carboxymuconolactone decarboxylase